MKIVPMGRPDASPGVIVGSITTPTSSTLTSARLARTCAAAARGVEREVRFLYVSSYDAVEQVPRDGDTFCAQVRTKCRRQREL